MIESVAVLAAAIYIFNIEYDKTLFNTWNFIQKFLLGISDGSKTPKKVVKLMSQMKAEN